MTKHEIIINWSESDNAYIAEVPELAGCMADGKTYINKHIKQAALSVRRKNHP